MDFSLCDRSAFRRHYLSVFLTICPAFCLPVMSAGDVLPRNWRKQISCRKRCPRSNSSMPAPATCSH